jgi:hypothetical protein
MIILEPSDERSPLKSEGEIDITTPAATAPLPPHAPTLSPNPIVPSYQAIPHSHYDTLPRRQSPIRRLLVAFAIACLVLFLCGAFIHSFYKRGRGYHDRCLFAVNPFSYAPELIASIVHKQIYNNFRSTFHSKYLSSFNALINPPQLTGSSSLSLNPLLHQISIILVLSPHHMIPFIKHLHQITMPYLPHTQWRVHHSKDTAHQFENFVTYLAGR